MADDYNKPNVVLPLAASYNPRGVEGFTATFQQNKDQRKVNSLYEQVGDQLYLKKRPGFLDSGVVLGASASEAPMLISNGIASGEYWTFTAHGGVVRVHSGGNPSTTVVTGSAGVYPAF